MMSSGPYSSTLPATEYHSTDPTVGIPTYRGTNAEEWRNKNIDNTAFPFQDRYPELSCSALLPIVKREVHDNSPLVTLGTSHFTNTYSIELGNGKTVDMSKVYVRPIDPFIPHYVEDTEFEACVPESSEIVDPPIHFKRRPNGNIAWCKEIYPTQNDAVDVLDQPYDGDLSDGAPGFVKPYTSHAVKNSASDECEATPLLTTPDEYWLSGSPTYSACSKNNLPAGSALRSNFTYIDTYIATNGSQQHICAEKTCDRTVRSGLTPEFKLFPLLANPKEVEDTLDADSSYECRITYDDGNGKAEVKTPASGCCAPSVVSLETGGVGAAHEGAHLEPDVSCLPPTY